MRNDKERVRLAYDQLAPHYDEGYGEPKDIAENEIIRRLTVPLTSGPVVDLGCGTGLFIDLHNGSVGQYNGFDLSPKMLERARIKHPDRRFVEQDMEDPWPIDRGSVGGVVSLFAFSYSLCPDRTIYEMSKALRPGGQFFIILYGQRWPSRHSYVEGRDGSQILYSAEDVAHLFAVPAFRDVSVRGVSRWVDHVRRAPLPIARAALELEVATILRVRPDLAYFLLVQGRRS